MPEADKGILTAAAIMALMWLAVFVWMFSAP